MKEDRSRVHLTSKDISRWLVEGSSPESEGHLQRCWTCQAKLAEAREPLTAFRAAVVAWSEAQPEGSDRSAVALRSGQRRGFRIWMPAGVALAAMILAAILIASGVFHGRSTPRQVANTPVVSDPDAVLMDQVDAEVSEAVPDAMAPLTDLVAWDSAEAPAGHVESGKRAVKGKPAMVAKTKTKATAAD